MTNAISVKERLKKQAIEDGKTMQDKLVTYVLANSYDLDRMELMKAIVETLKKIYVKTH